MKTETELPLAEQPDTLPATTTKDRAIEACDRLGIDASHANLQYLEALFTTLKTEGYNAGVKSNERLIEETVAQAEGMQTSIIRATVASIMEATVPSPWQNDFSVTMNLEAQRTIWDRYELTTERDASQENVTFIITRK